MDLQLFARAADGAIAPFVVGADLDPESIERARQVVTRHCTETQGAAPRVVLAVIPGGLA